MSLATAIAAAKATAADAFSDAFLTGTATLTRPTGDPATFDPTTGRNSIPTAVAALDPATARPASHRATLDGASVEDRAVVSAPADSDVVAGDVIRMTSNPRDPSLVDVDLFVVEVGYGVLVTAVCLRRDRLDPAAWAKATS